MIMRMTAIVLSGAVTLAACGGSGGSGVATVTVPPPATAASDTTIAEAITDIPGTVPDETRPTTTPPRENRNKVTDQGSAWIDVALLPDDALPPPWEAQWRKTNRTAYGAGPNQTDCEPYWTIEELRAGDGGHAMWWIDGGNANHYVSRLDNPSDVGFLFEMATIAEQCPIVYWNEGGSFTTELFELDEAIGFRFEDVDSGEVTWFALTVHDDLISVLDVPLWTIEGGYIDFDVDDLNRLGTQMSKLLRSAGQIPTLPTTPTTRPSNDPATTIPTTTMPTTTRPSRTTLPEVLPPRGLDQFLVGAGELPDGFLGSEISPYRPGPSDDELLAACPAAAAINRMDTILQWEADFDNDAGTRIGHIIGRADSVDDASDVVTLFAQIAECDVSASFGSDATASGGLLPIDGADTASSLVIGTTEGVAGELILTSVGDVVMVISVGVSGEVGSDEVASVDLELADAIATRAVARVRAAEASADDDGG